MVFTGKKPTWYYKRDIYNSTAEEGEGVCGWCKANGTEDFKKETKSPKRDKNGKTKSRSLYWLSIKMLHNIIEDENGKIFCTTDTTLFGLKRGPKADKKSKTNFMFD
ncbi:hypothetical protein SNE40_006838 [Patella caerulea]|uniref:Uncharacterized protein n=1 Tax=Patella caerulea TaxID=87958 RepID=A0AAN8JVA4_PATCE